MSHGRGPPDVAGMHSLKVDNLTYRTTTEDLRRLFDKYGEIGDVYIPRDRFNRDSRGFAFIRYFDKRDADDAMDALDGTIVDGRELRIQLAKYGRPADPRRRYDSGRRRQDRDDRSRSRSRSRDRYDRRRKRSYSRSRSRTPSRSRSKTPRRDSRSRSRSH